MPGDPAARFTSWPLAMAAVTCFSSGILILETSTGEPADAAAAALVVIGAMCMGAWLFALGAGGHTGRSSSPLPPPPSKKEDDS